MAHFIKVLSSHKDGLCPNKSLFLEALWEFSNCIHWHQLTFCTCLLFAVIQELCFGCAPPSPLLSSPSPSPSLPSPPWKHMLQPPSLNSSNYEKIFLFWEWQKFRSIITKCSRERTGIGCFTNRCLVKVTHVKKIFAVSDEDLYCFSCQ